MFSRERAYLFLNGELEGSEKFFKEYLKKESGDIYCADGGYRHCKSLEIQPQEVWGDMDSVDSLDLEKLDREGITLRKFSRDKNFTDGELLMEYVHSKGYDEMYVIGGLGGDRAHELTNLNLMTKYTNLVFLAEKETIFVMKEISEIGNHSEIVNHKVIKNQKGREVSFIPMSDRVENLTLKGFRYPLNSYNLQRGESICMSNIIDEEICSISFDSGVLLGILKNN